jgi:3-oxoacyl-ACP reductase-like protein
MSILGSIISKIFHGPEAAAATAATPAAASATQTAASAPAAAETAAASPSAETPKAAGQQVDVEAVLDALDEKNPEELDWRNSIVDLMKLLSLDSSHAARVELAKELHYTGNMQDSAAMNIWLHAQVMTKLAENGGKVPDDLKKH